MINRCSSPLGQSMRRFTAYLKLSDPYSRHHRHTQPQKMLRVLPFLKDDLDWYSLHHFDVVPGGVFGGQQAEERPGCTGDAEDMSIVGTAIGIDGDFHRLSRPHMLQLGFLEVGSDPDI